MNVTTHKREENEACDVSFTEKTTALFVFCCLKPFCYMNIKGFCSPNNTRTIKGEDEQTEK